LVAVTNAVAFVRGFGETALHLDRPQHLIIANRPFLLQIEAVPEQKFNYNLYTFTRLRFFLAVFPSPY